MLSLNYKVYFWAGQNGTWLLTLFFAKAQQTISLNQIFKIFVLKIDIFEVIVAHEEQWFVIYYKTIVTFLIFELVHSWARKD